MAVVLDDFFYAFIIESVWTHSHSLAMGTTQNNKKHKADDEDQHGVVALTTGCGWLWGAYLVKEFFLFVPAFPPTEV